jgi:hypothetical protein
MKKTTFLISLILTAFLASCTDSTNNPCSSTSNVNDPECQKQIPTVDSRPLTLAVTFVSSYFYDQNAKTWQEIKKENLEGGIVGLTVPVYSDFLNVSTKAAMSKILLAKTQKDNSSTYSESDFSKIPYFEVAVEDGVDYIFNYTKTDLNNQIVFQKEGKLTIQDSRAILPLINETFDGQFFAATANVGSRYTHSISIAAQSKDKRGSRTNSVVFEAVLQIPNTDFYVSYAQSALDFNLQNRWSTYYAGTDGTPNTNFQFLTLKEIKTVSEQVPLELKITFQEPPAVKLLQEVFFEMPFDIDQIKNTGTVTPQRGYNFYIQRQEMTGTLPSPQGQGPDFQMKLKVNGQNLSLTSGREAQISVGAGVPWNIEVYYDFTQHANYSSPGGTGMITPLRPVCHQDRGVPFLPITETNAKNTAIASGGYLSICHPTENRTVVIQSTDMATTPYSLSDTFYGHFSYVPFDMFKREVGHFYGIRSVTMRMSGCVKVEVRNPGEVAWTVKSQSNSICDVAGAGTNQGWVYFFAEKQATIFDNINDYEGVSGLKALMQSFGSSPVKSTPNFFFNGADLSPTRKLY